jgi:arsenite methyltransferase
MAITCPVDLDTIRLRQEIREIYARVAAEPSSEFHFHRGPAYAAERLGYDSAALAALPFEATASFAASQIPFAWPRSHQGRQSLTSAVAPVWT